MKRLITTSGILCFAIAALAMGSYLKVAKDTYKFPDSSPAGKAMCMLCHTTKMGGATHLNAYGLDLKAALTAKGTKTITPAILHSIDNLDSNKDGVKNGASLKEGKLPG
ncbi:MAG: hypothetical protein ACHQ50_04380 [Fimbriimonadales bacterium]